MNTSQSTQNYDLFKLFVALVLLALLIVFLLKGAPEKPAVSAVTQSPPLVSEEASPTTQVPPATESAPPASTSTATFPEFPASSKELKLDADNEQLLAPDGSPAYTLDAGSLAWIPAVPDEIKSNLPEGYQLVEPSPDEWAIYDKENGNLLLSWNPETLEWQQPVESESAVEEITCPLALPARLQVGKQAKVLTNLNMRSSPGIQDNWMLTNIARTKLEVIGGPVCLPYEGGAHLWWQVKNPGEITGWSAEASLQGNSYYLEPVP